jgi:hypothetical protein
VQCLLVVGTATDCDGNGVPDQGQIPPLDDCDGDGIPDVCGPTADCDGDGTSDVCEIADGAADCNANWIPDECERSSCAPENPACQDCNGNNQLDECDIADGTSFDCDQNGRPDDCDVGTIYTIYVDADAQGTPKNGTNWTNAYNDLQAALSAAASSGVGRDIWVAAGMYKPAGPGGDKAASFVLPECVRMYGGFPGEPGQEGNFSVRNPSAYPTILSGDLDGNDGPDFANRDDNAYNVVSARNMSVASVLDGFTIRGGNASWEAPEWGGAAVLFDGGSPTVNHCTVRDNEAFYWGAAIYCTSSASPRVADCTISGNRAGSGAGVYCEDGAAPLIVNCAMAGNAAGGYGGAIQCHEGGKPTIVNCTFAGNQAASGGRALHCYSSATRSTVTIANCILWDGGDEVLNEDSSTIAVTYSNVQGGWTGTGNIGADPVLHDPRFVDTTAPFGAGLRLKDDSPCIDVGDNNAVPSGITTDLNGNPRFVDGGHGLPPIVDMGAFEYPSCNAVPVDHDGDRDVDLADFGAFQACFNGPNRAYQPTGELCMCMDTDPDDGDVDLADFGVFQACFNGPNRPPRCLADGGGGGMKALARGGGLLDGPESVDVTFDLQSPQDGQTITQGDWVQWTAIVSVEGTNQGLGGFIYSLFIGPGTGPSPGPDGIWCTADDENLANVTLETAYGGEVFAVAGPNGKPTSGTSVTAGGSAGGPGMNAMSNGGDNSTPGMLVQVGAGWLDWDPWRQGGPPFYRWTGDDTWGVGLADRRSVLLLDANGQYELNVGWLDTTNVAPGHYVLVLVPSDSISVLRSDVDLSVKQIGGVIAPTAAVSAPDSIAFDVTTP